MFNFNPLAKIDVPDSWATLEDFMRWYLDSNCPIAPPHDYEIYTVAEGILVFALFRKGPYQVEMYMIENKDLIEEHEHPYVEVIQMPIYQVPERDNAGLARWAEPSEKLVHGQRHGGIPLPPELQHYARSLLIVFQKWPPGIRQSTISVSWKGVSMGPKHEALVRRHFPDVYIKDGFIDITRTMEPATT